MKTTALIDADIIAFKASAATEKLHYFDGKDQPPCIEHDTEQAYRAARGLIEKVADKLRADRVVVCLTDDVNFRTAVWPAYKGNRVGLRKPTDLAAVKAWLAASYETYQRPGLEADDCMGILASHKTLIPGRKIMVSEDKDMKTVPAWIFNPDKDDEPRLVSKVSADRYHMEQTLTGDPTDGYPGCPGIGPRSPFVLGLAQVETTREMWELVVAGYESKGLTEADAVTMARLARILRATDWDFENKRPRLWTPPVK